MNADFLVQKGQIGYKKKTLEQTKFHWFINNS